MNYSFPNAAHTLRIKETEFVEFADVDGGVGEVGWIGHHDYVRSLAAALGVRGLRARYGDIQVGKSNLFEDSFKEVRFNGWTVGELLRTRFYSPVCSRYNGAAKVLNANMEPRSSSRSAKWSNSTHSVGFCAARTVYRERHCPLATAILNMASNIPMAQSARE